MKDINRRIEKIEKELDIENKTKWLCLPLGENGELVEIKGCRNLAEFLVLYLD
jgi:hypothetical protein